MQLKNARLPNQQPYKPTKAGVFFSNWLIQLSRQNIWWRFFVAELAYTALMSKYFGGVFFAELAYMVGWLIWMLIMYAQNFFVRALTF